MSKLPLLVSRTDGLSSTLTTGAPLPTPASGATVAHGTSLVAVHRHPAPVVSVNVIFPPVPETVPGIPATVTAQLEDVVPGTVTVEGAVGLELAVGVDADPPQAAVSAASTQAATLVVNR